MEFTTRKLSHYTLPFKSNLNGMIFVPLHHTLTIMKRNMTMPLLDYLSGIGLMPFHCIMVVVEGDMTMPPS
jgi:hypothetical protein